MDSIGFEMLEMDRKEILSDNIFSTLCSLSNGTDTQGGGAILDPSDPDYNPDDKLKCLGNFIGLTLVDDEDRAFIGDSAEASLNISDVLIGRPEQGWSISFYQGGIKKLMHFKVKDVLEDRTTGTYRIKLSNVKSVGTGKIINRQGIGGI